MLIRRYVKFDFEIGGIFDMVRLFQGRGGYIYVCVCMAGCGVDMHLTYMLLCTCSAMKGNSSWGVFSASSK